MFSVFSIERAAPIYASINTQKSTQNDTRNQAVGEWTKLDRINRIFRINEGGAGSG